MTVHLETFALLSLGETPGFCMPATVLSGSKKSLKNPQRKYEKLCKASLSSLHFGISFMKNTFFDREAIDKTGNNTSGVIALNFGK